MTATLLIVIAVFETSPSLVCLTPLFVTGAVVVGGITPTPLGEGKSTTTVGLSQVRAQHPRDASKWWDSCESDEAFGEHRRWVPSWARRW